MDLRFPSPREQANSMEPPRPAASPHRPAHPHDTMLTLSLSLAPPISPNPHARRPRAEGGARVRCSPTGDTPPCTECGKRFPSWKALFGHMRCHPERQWRGITPPPHFGRHSAARASAGLQFTVQEREVAASLLMLSGALSPGAGKGKKTVSAAAAAFLSATESCGTSASTPPGPANCDDHRCSVCDRGFSSGQALGGHKRCHWERAYEEGAAVATVGGSVSSTLSDAAAVAAVLDLNLPPQGPPPVRKSDESSQSLNVTLDLKLGY